MVLPPAPADRGDGVAATCDMVRETPPASGDDLTGTVAVLPAAPDASPEALAGEGAAGGAADLGDASGVVVREKPALDLPASAALPGVPCSIRSAIMFSSSSLSRSPLNAGTDGPRLGDWLLRSAFESASESVRRPK
jgi:hypothetical protein